MSMNVITIIRGKPAYRKLVPFRNQKSGYIVRTAGGDLWSRSLPEIVFFDQPTSILRVRLDPKSGGSAC